MEHGLPQKDAEEKLNRFGKNEILVSKPLSSFTLFVDQFPTGINGILASAAGISLFIGDFIDGIFIFTILFLNALFGFFQEYKAEKSLEKLKNLITPLSRVIRDGKEIQIQTVDLVPEDIIIILEGDRIPADSTLLSSSLLEIDESILTGESIPVVKNHNSVLFSGTLVVKGKGKAMVQFTGMQTRFGKIAKTLSTIERNQTPLEIKLAHLGRSLSLIALFASFLLIPLGLFQHKPLFPLILLAVSLGVAAIPEGLPAVITIALAIGTNKMAKKNAIVRKMQAIETLGCVQILLIDKTGTLTQNVMRVKKYWIKHESDLPFLIRASLFGNTASLIQKADGKDVDIVGDRTDGALLLWATQQNHVLQHNEQVVDEYAFDPLTRTVTTVTHFDNIFSIFVRGAPEAVIAHSNLTKAEKEHAQSLFKDYAQEGLRVIAFGYKATKSYDAKREQTEHNLSLLGMVGIYDPPRKEAYKAINEAKTAGIRVVMVTGDNELTALSIAKEVGLIEKDEDIMTGEVLRSLSDIQLTDVILKTRIFARALPEDKLRLVSVLKSLGYVVGVTGDGVNDSLAIKKADVGISMGITGTDVSKEASDIILLDDNFSTLIHAVEEGRRIYRNIINAITYLLSGNLAELSLVFLAGLLGLPTPLLPTQILWINLVTDGLPALALASDNKTTYLLNEKPRDPKIPILTKNRMVFIIIVGFSIALFLIFLYKYLLLTNSEVFARTVIFNTLIFLHLLIAFIVRGKSFFKVHPFLLIAIVTTFLLQGVISLLPFTQNIFHLGLTR